MGFIEQQPQVGFFNFDRHVRDYKQVKTQREIEMYLSSPDHITDARPGRMCGDGRYNETQGKLARFGADGGYLLGLLKLNNDFDLRLTPEQAAVATMKATDGPFTLHTECGHLTLPTMPKYMDQYKLDPADVAGAIDFVKALGQKHPEKVKVVEVDGPHREQAVLINTGENKKIAHRDKDQQYFKIDATREDKYARGFFRRLNGILNLTEQGATYEDFRKILDYQTNVTAGILAAGLPMYQVNADTAGLEVKFLKHVT